MKAIEKAEAAMREAHDKHKDKFINPWEWATPNTQKVISHADVVKPFATFTVLGVSENGRGGKAVAVHHSRKRDEAREYVRLQQEQGAKHEFFGRASFVTVRSNSSIAQGYLAQLPKEQVKQQASEPKRQPKAHRKEQQLTMGF
jgi:hypothetical protein